MVQTLPPGYPPSDKALQQAPMQAFCSHGLGCRSCNSSTSAMRLHGTGRSCPARPCQLQGTQQWHALCKLGHAPAPLHQSMMWLAEQQQPPQGWRGGVHAARKEASQQGPLADQGQEEAQVAQRMLLDSGNKWRWPSLGGPQTGTVGTAGTTGSGGSRGKGGGQRGGAPQLPGSSQMAKRLYGNEELQELVRQDMERASNKRWGTPPWPTQPDPPPSQGSGQPGSPPGPPDLGVDDDMPPPPGFFSSRDEAKRFMDWMAKKRTARMQQVKETNDTEIAGIARIYLVLAVCVIVAGLLSL